MEHIAESGGILPKYSRLIVFSTNGINRQTLEDLRQHNALELKEDAWTKMEGWITTAVKDGGGNNGVRPAMDYGDTTVISYYDGSRWQIAVWMWFERYLEQLHNPPGPPPLRPPGSSSTVRRPVPSPEVVAYGDLLNFLDTCPGVRERFAPEWYDYFKQYIEYLPQNQAGKNK